MATPRPPVTVAKVRAALRRVTDPELGVDIVSLGFIYGITVQKESVAVLMTLTTPACPLAPLIAEQVRCAVASCNGVTAVTVDLTFDPPWNPSMMRSPGRSETRTVRKTIQRK